MACQTDYITQPYIIGITKKGENNPQLYYVTPSDVKCDLILRTLQCVWIPCASWDQGSMAATSKINMTEKCQRLSCSGNFT